MQQKINIKFKVLTILLLMSALCHGDMFGINPDLNYPRIGDMVELLEIDNIKSSSTEGPKLIDLSNSSISGISYLKVYAPAREDTVTEMMVFRNNRVEYLFSENGLLLTSHFYQPGESRTYMPSLPYLQGQDSTFQVESGGFLTKIGNFSSEGLQTGHISFNTKIITFDGDTLEYVESLTTQISESLIYQNGDTLIHTGLQEKYLVNGYRYPMLTLSDDLLISLQGDTIDHIRKWEAISLNHQEERIKNDPLNEMIRNSLKNVEKPHGTHHGGISNGSNSYRQGNFQWDPDSKILTVLPSLNESSSESQYIICDSHGFVWDSGKFNTDGSLQLSLVNYPPGVYIFGYFTGEGVNTFKISTLQQ